MATKKTAAKKSAAAAPAIKKLGTMKESMTKTALLTSIAERTGLKKKEVDAVFASLAEHIEAHLKKGGTGIFTLPGLAKMKVIRKPATKARKGINPFTGEETMFKAKPARNVVKILPLKATKTMVA